MKYFVIPLLLLTSCSSGYSSNAQMKGMSGHAYMDCQQAVMLSPLIASRDLTDEEIEEAENMPGGGYSDGKWTGENPEKCDNYAAQQVWEDEDGTIIILEDDGEITYVSKK